MFDDVNILHGQLFPYDASFTAACVCLFLYQAALKVLLLPLSVSRRVALLWWRRRLWVSQRPGASALRTCVVQVFCLDKFTSRAVCQPLFSGTKLASQGGVPGFAPQQQWKGRPDD